MGRNCRSYVDIMAMHPGVTGSCILAIAKLVNGRTIKFVVDCGLFQGKKEKKEVDEEPKEDFNEVMNSSLPFNPEEIDFCLVTHNHIDHIGRLPFMVKKGFSNPIYATESTTKLMKPALENSAKVLKETAKRKNTACLYSDSDVASTLMLRKPCKFEEPIKVCDGVTVTFLVNGHLPGAALILVQIETPEGEDINLLFTGDYNNNNMFFYVPKIPEWVAELPVTVVIESTYGDMESSGVTKCFRENVIEQIGKNGSVVAPVFSLGRSQEILYELKCMQDCKALNTSVPIYLDGNLAVQYTNIYLKDGLDIRQEMRDFLPKNFTFADKSNRQDVLIGRESKIILTTSGMGTYGSAQLYIPEYISRWNSLIHFTGYTAEGTLGSNLKKAKQGDIVEIGGTKIKKIARVEYTTEYSAHAKADELIDLLRQFKNLRFALVNHGEVEVKDKFAERILNETEVTKVGILGREYFFRVNRWGLVKTVSSKFK